MKNSNETIRKRAIWKAILLTVIPMIISGVGVYLYHQNYCGCHEKENVDWKKQYETLAADNLTFRKQVTNFNDAWIDYTRKNDDFFSNIDSVAIIKIDNEISKSGTALLNINFNADENFKDTSYTAILSSLNERVEKYLKDMEEYRVLKKMIDGDLNNGACCENLILENKKKDSLKLVITQLEIKLDICEGGGGLDNKRLEIGEKEIASLGRQITQLEADNKKCENEKLVIFKKMKERFRVVLFQIKNEDFKKGKLTDEMVTETLRRLSNAQ